LSARSELQAGEAAFDHWVAGMGGYASDRFTALHGEALEFAGPDGYSAYLTMAQALDEGHAAHSARRQAGRRARAAARRTEEAAAAVLERSTEIRLAMDELLAHPRLADAPDLSAGPPLTAAEVALELRASMGLATRPPSLYEASLPPVADLARTIGLRR
jgi:hypothetical protein